MAPTCRRDQTMVASSKGPGLVRPSSCACSHLMRRTPVDMISQHLRMHLPLLAFAFFMGVIAGCSNSQRSPDRGAGGTARDTVWFDDVTDEAGLGEFRHHTGARGDKWMPETYGSGGGFIDYNDDGWPDILLVAGGRWTSHPDSAVAAVRLYRNDGDGTYTDVTSAAGLADVRTYGMGVTVADYDNDGDDDFFLTSLHRDYLFRNDDGQFVDVSRETGVQGADQWSTCAVFFDANRDSHLDLYVCGYVRWTPETDLFCTPDGKRKDYCTPQQYQSVPGRFYINDGDGTFTERTSANGFADMPGKSLGAVALDYNRDGWPDLAVANDTRRDLLFKNNGDGTFEEIGITSGIAYDYAGNATGGMGIDAGVIDSTGKTTLVIGNFLNESIGLFQQTSDDMFAYRSGPTGIRGTSMMTVAFGTFFFDVELDGDLDLLVVNGHVQRLVARQRQGVTYEQKPHLFINRGDGTFREASAAGPLGAKYVARGSAYADVDRDGDEDVLITENGGPVHLLINRAIDETVANSEASRRRPPAEAQPNFLSVQLRGTESNEIGRAHV